MRKEELSEAEVYEESWNIRRIIVTFIGIALFFGGAYFFLLKDSQEFQYVLGVATQTLGKPDESQRPKPVSIKSIQLEKQLEHLKEQVNNLNIEDLATSSPQMQKLISDFEALKELPKKQVQEACLNMCKNL